MEKLTQSYVDLKQIGAGGMATVFVGLHPSLNRLVAIKVVKGDNKDKIKRFEREAMISASMKQDNLPTIFDYFMDSQGTHYLVMEYVEGIDVSEIVKKRGPIPPPIVAMIVREAARGLEHMHELGVIHRDIKPSNVRLGKNGHVKLMDFGIAKQESDDQQKNLTHTGIIIGTPSYMSPEQAAGDRLTMQTDIFSLGTMMYEMLTGRKPFHADNNMTLITLIAQGRFESLYHSDAHLPPAIIEIVHKAMAKSQRVRYHSAGLLIKDINSYLRNMSQSQMTEVLTEFHQAVRDPEKPDLKKFNLKLSPETVTPTVSMPTSGPATAQKSFLRSFVWMGLAVSAFLIGWLTLALHSPASPNDLDYGRVRLWLSTQRSELLKQARIFVNETEIPNVSSQNAVFLSCFQAGNNVMRVEFPGVPSDQAFHFDLTDSRDTATFVVDLDKALARGAAASDNRRLGFLVTSEPAGAAVYVNTDTKSPLGTTPLFQSWQSQKGSVQRIIIKKTGFISSQINRPFENSGYQSLHVILKPDR
ncbi:MAG: serine/threonine protein kinase [Bacteroidetes bacterium]|nr:serine/threonine protein kinase [Bacteroidota bacterium]